MSPLKCLWMTTSLSLWFAATPGPRLARAARSQPRLRTIVAAPCVRWRCRCRCRCRCGVWCVVCGVSPLESPHLLTTAGPVVAHSYTRTGTPAHWHARGTSSASQPGHSAQLTDETAANMNISSDMLHMIRTSLHCPVYRVSRVLSNNQHPVLY